MFAVRNNISVVSFEVSDCTKFQIFRGSVLDPTGGAYRPWKRVFRVLKNREFGLWKSRKVVQNSLLMSVRTPQLSVFLMVVCTCVQLKLHTTCSDCLTDLFNCLVKWVRVLALLINLRYSDHKSISCCWHSQWLSFLFTYVWSSRDEIYKYYIKLRKYTYANLNI